MSSSLTFQLPVPSRILSPNNRSHWHAVAEAKRKARLAAKIEAARVLADAGIRAPKWGKARMAVTLFHLTARTPDPGNLMASLKAYEDGLQDAGIIANDRNLWPDRPRYQRVARMARIEITVTPEP